MLRRNYCFNGLNVISDIVRRFTENTDNLTFDEKEKNYLFAIELTDSIDSMLSLAILYQSTNEYMKAEKYYKMALDIDDNDIIIRYNLANMYLSLYMYTYSTAFDIVWFENALYHFSIAADLNDIEAMWCYIQNASLVECAERREKTIKYLSMFINHHNYKKDYCFTLSQKLQMLSFYDKILFPLPENIVKEKNRIRNEPDVSIYKNKIQLFTKLNHICECQICYDESLQIDLTCGHCFCTSCYVKIHDNPCPICKL